jgi:hypothetical protein
MQSRSASILLYKCSLTRSQSTRSDPLRLSGPAGARYRHGLPLRWQQREILTLHADEQWHGNGDRPDRGGRQLARRRGCTRLWGITTNDNADALRFYQRRGFDLVRVHRGAVDRSGAMLKPEIPPVGAYGIPKRDEIGLEKHS